MGIYGVIGFPIGHSMSPIMHNREFQALQLGHHYTAFSVHPEQLKVAMDGIRALGIKGINVTIPHKVTIMKYLDEIDEEAQLIGAVNTVFNDNGKLIGSNTDGQGYVRSLLSLVDSPLATKNVLVIGAGGAARAIVTSLALHGIKQMDIVNRTTSKAEELATHASQFVPAKAVTMDLAENHLHKYALIINTTSVGMAPHVNETPLQINSLRKGTIVSDLIYNPLKTMLLKKAEEKGAVIDNGIGMFVHQGALAFEKWTGIEPNIERMTETVLKELGG